MQYTGVDNEQVNTLSRQQLDPENGLCTQRSFKISVKDGEN